MRELSDAECDDLMLPCLAEASADARVFVRAGYAAGCAAALAYAKPAPSAEPPTARAVTDGPAADPIADLCAELRATHCSNENLHDNAAYELERLARENAALRAFYGDQHIRDRLANAEQVETENDALRAIVRAADWMRRAETGIELAGATVAYDRARAAWKGEGQ